MKSDKKIKRRLVALGVLGMLVLVLCVPLIFAAPSWDDGYDADKSYYISIDDNNDDPNDQAFAVSKHGDPSSGTELFRVQENGNVGIGTDDPDRILDVLDTSGPQLRLTYTGGTLYTDFQTTSNGYLYIRPFGQRVGIMTSSPQATLQVGGTVIPTYGSIDRIAILPYHYSTLWMITARDDVNNAHLDLKYGATTILTTRDDGNVGIGTTSPSTKLHVDGDVAFGDGSELTISSGVVTATDSYHTIDTEGNAGTDDLDTINGGSVAGEILIIRADNSGRTVIAKDGTGNLQLSGDFIMNNAEDTLTLIYDGSNWLELSHSDNGL